uniref:Uncharacterized protein n=1 Tax=Lepeophtheirus salmonis TaxID=72036 RepID=A0A0K2V0Y4_LEPSM
MKCNENYLKNIYKECFIYVTGNVP